MTRKQLAQEYPLPNEASIIDDLARRLQAKVVAENTDGVMRRDAHPKMHGVVKAEFTIEADLPASWQVGVFSQAKTYQAWIRFSNQNSTGGADLDRDIRGMAIKLMGVPGEKLLEAEKDEQTQDFLFISTPVFITRDVEQFDAMVKAFTASAAAKLWFGLMHPRVLWNMFKSMRRVPNCLQISYFSTTPYRMGEHAVKYCVVPRSGVADGRPNGVPDGADPDFLRLAMLEQLEQGEAVFDFMVQLQTDADAMPIEDPGVQWSEARSPYRKVATVRILQQSFDSDAQRRFGQNLSFSPWHCLPEHRPLGGINRARKVIYNAISAFRHKTNGDARCEPVSWNI